MRNYTGDEGRSFEFDNQVLISSHRKLLSSKAAVVKRYYGLGGETVLASSLRSTVIDGASYAETPGQQQSLPRRLCAG
jgi:hypothetical protein